MKAPSDFLAEFHLYVHCCLSVWPNPQSKCNPLLLFPPPLAIIPPSLLRCVWIPSPPTLPVTGPSVWPPLNCCCRLELCHSSSCCIVFGNDAYGTWSGKWVCEKSLAAAYMSCCLFHLGKQTLCILLTSHLTSILHTVWLLIPLISWGFDIWPIMKLCGCVPVRIHVRL